MTRTSFLIVILVAGLAADSRSQSRGAEVENLVGENRDALIKAASAEMKRGPTLNYEQNYRSAGKDVVIKGTLYAGITTFAATKCHLSIGSTVVDRYAGQNNKVALKDTQSVYNYAGELFLTPELADSIRIVEARPSQFERGTHPQCAEGRECSIHWLEFRAKNKVMKLTSTTNDIAGYEGFVRDFDGMVGELWIPLSSEQAGTELVSLLKSFAATCDK